MLELDTVSLNISGKNVVITGKDAKQLYDFLSIIYKEPHECKCKEPAEETNVVNLSDMDVLKQNESEIKHVLKKNKFAKD